jgi:hypothetical protein
MMRPYWLSFVVAAVGVIPAGCSDQITAPASDIAPLFQTDSSSYVLRATTAGWQTEIGVTFTNRSGGEALIINCLGSTPIELDKLIGADWVEVWLPGLLACSSPPIAVANGERYQTTIFVFGGYPGSNSAPKFSITDLDGVYRLKWGGIVNGSNLLPEEWRVSNQFRLVAQPEPR